jgi:hypothetical protein
MDARGRALIRVGCRLFRAAGIGLVLTLLPAPFVANGAMAQGATAQSSPLSASGHVIGNLRSGQLLRVTLDVRHTDGWQRIEEVGVALQLHGTSLEELVIEPTLGSIEIRGVTSPVALGNASVLRGTFLEVRVSAVSLTAKGADLRLSIPIRLRTAPPPGGRLTYEARGFDVTSTGAKSLTPPVESNGGFSWGTLALAIVVALFAGSLVGGTFASRRRPAVRPSVYATIRRRLDEERAPR